VQLPQLIVIVNSSTLVHVLNFRRICPVITRPLTRTWIIHNTQLHLMNMKLTYRWKNMKYPRLQTPTSIYST